ncbi:hypothetical protein BH10ACT8_BH10ACT8_24160 [soil metagenome]
MTESRPPHRTAGGADYPGTHPDSDTTALPRIEEPPAWAPAAPASSSYGSDANTVDPYRADPYGTEFSGADKSGPDLTTSGGLSGFGAKLTAAGASAVAAATSAAASAKESVRGAGSSAGVQIPMSSTDGTATPPPTSASAGRNPAAKASRGRAARSTSRQPRKARLTLSHINVYSVFKFSCVLAIALFFVWLIMVGVLYGLLDVAGVLTQVNDAVARISGGSNTKPVVTGSIVFGGAIIIGAVYIVLFIAMSTIGSMVYNLCADLVGGVEVTLSERE